MQNEEIAIVYSTDNNYAQHTGVSIISLLENNRELGNVKIYIIDNNISDENRFKLKNVVSTYKREIKFIDFKEYQSKLKLNMIWDLSLSSYARLFISSMLPKNVKKAIYYDCDSIINGSIKNFWENNLSNYYVAGVLDPASDNTKVEVGLKPNDIYINAGVLLINLEKWRQDNIEEKFLEFINSYEGRVYHHDQGVINGVLNNYIKVINPEFNAMTVFFTMSLHNILYFYEISGKYYSIYEIQRAIDNPIFIHYTPGFTKRPWIKGSKHPEKELYQKYLQISPWKNIKPMKDTSKLQIKIVNWIFTHIPLKIAKGTVNLLKHDGGK